MAVPFVSSRPLIGADCLRQCGCFTDLRLVGLCAGDNRTAEFTKLNPMKKVPVMVDNGFKLTERYELVGAVLRP